MALLAFPSWYRKSPFIAGSAKVITPGHILMQHPVNKALTCQVAANMIGCDGHEHPQPQMNTYIAHTTVAVIR